MKKILKLLCMMLLAPLVLASCLKDNETSVEVHSDTAITAVTLGTLNRYTRTTSSKTGNDTIIKTTLAGSSYRLTIDQLGHAIFNRDSLPLGTDLKHVVLSSVLTKNGGVAFIKSLISDTLFYIRTTDSLDFSSPRTVRVVASNGIDYRDYTMKLSASTTKGTTFGWQLVRQDDNLAGWTDQRLVAVNDSVALEDTDYLGATAHELFKIDEGRLKVSFDEGLTWSDETLDESETLLPSSAMAMVSWKYAPADSTDYVLLAGNSEQDTKNAVLWRKLSRYHANGQPTEGTWVYMPIDGYNHYTLPRQDYLSMTYYNNNVLAVGSNMKLYMSRDQGITWRTQSIYALPKQIEGTRATIAADSRERLWLLTDSGQLWMGSIR